MIIKKPIPTIDKFYACLVIPPELHTQSLDVTTIKGNPNVYVGSDRKSFVTSVGAGG